MHTDATAAAAAAAGDAHARGARVRNSTSRGKIILHTNYCHVITPRQ